MEDQLFLPNLDYWCYGNKWTGSLHRACFYVEPAEEKFCAEIWTGPLCRAESTPEETAEFPLDEPGLAALRQWLLDRAEEINRANPGAYEYEW